MRRSGVELWAAVHRARESGALRRLGRSQSYSLVANIFSSLFPDDYDRVSLACCILELRLVYGLRRCCVSGVCSNSCMLVFTAFCAAARLSVHLYLLYLHLQTDAGGSACMLSVCVYGSLQPYMCSSLTV